MFLRPIRIKPLEDALSAPVCRAGRVSMVIDVCKAETPEVQKRLITTLYESEHLTEAEAIELFRILDLKEA